MQTRKTIWTIGHSTRSEEEFISLLKSFFIETLVDIRTLPGSRKFPHFNQDALSATLKLHGISYVHFPDLGGRRKATSDSKNMAWRHPSFRGYADYMETPQFMNAIQHLEQLALVARTAYMCSEAVWWRCHRALVSDFLKVREWQVMHIMDTGKSTEHPFTSPAREVQGKLFY
jgi:uncharacterized protein (DUF488 family)